MEAQADYAKLSFSVQGYGSSLRSAIEKAKERIATISEDLLAVGLKKEQLNTSKFYSGENVGGKAFLSNKKDYRTSLTMYLSMKDLTLLEPVLVLLSEQKVEKISDIRFLLKDDEQYKRQARLLAIQKARRKAGEFADELKIQLGPATMVEELPLVDMQPEHQYQFREQVLRSLPNHSYLQSGAVMLERGSYFSDTIKVTAQVKVVFKIKN